MRPGERKKIEIMVDCQMDTFFEMRVELDNQIIFYKCLTSNPTIEGEAIALAAKAAFFEIFSPRKSNL